MRKQLWQRPITLLAVTSAGAATLLALAWAERPYPVGSGTRWMLASAQAAVGAGLILLWSGAAFWAVDEMIRRLIRDAMAVAFVLAGALAVAYGFMRDAGVPDVEWAYVWPLMVLCFLLSFGVAWRRQV